eukprot:458280-Hanusia_phi.AAC.1
MSPRSAAVASAACQSLPLSSLSLVPGSLTQLWEQGLPTRPLRRRGARRQPRRHSVRGGGGWRRGGGGGG